MASDNDRDLVLFRDLTRLFCDLVRDPILLCDLVRDPILFSDLVRDPILSCDLVRDPILSCDLVRDPILFCDPVCDPIISGDLVRDPILFGDLVRDLILFCDVVRDPTRFCDLVCDPILFGDPVRDLVLSVEWNREPDLVSDRDVERERCSDLCVEDRRLIGDLQQYKITVQHYRQQYQTFCCLLLQSHSAPWTPGSVHHFGRGKQADCSVTYNTLCSDQMTWLLLHDSITTDWRDRYTTVVRLPHELCDVF